LRILITGGTGMVGSCFKSLKTNHDLVTVGSRDYDLRSRSETEKMMKDHSPEAIIHLAARVGGVKGNTDYVCDFFYDNIMINTNVLQAASDYSVKKLVSLLSTCVYPDVVSYPLTEDQVHKGEPHKSNFGYAYAKRMLDVHSRALRKQYGCNFICAIPNNLYGPFDNFDLNNGHVIPAIIRKIYEAKRFGNEPVFWGSGKTLREFTYSYDISKILLHLIDNYDSDELVNIGKVGEDSICNIVEKVCEILEYHGEARWNISKPEGQHRKPSCNKRLIDTGWKNEFYTSIDKGLELTCEWFINNYPDVRGVD